MTLVRSILVPILFFLCLLDWKDWKIDAVIYSGGLKGSGEKYRYPETDFTIQKVSLTQKGYIQFLKYTTEVPTLRDYTFCIWVRSHNLTYNHPLLSYSKHEEDRLIRVWISEKGEDLCLEILNHPIFKVPVNLIENIWYHVCQSWSAHDASWHLFLNGKLKSSGVVPKLKDVPIEGGGDIVVGQEYTDFDKGLDDGIEGDVFGFNFVLSPTSTPDRHSVNPIKFANYPLRRRFDGTRFRPQPYAKPLNIHQPLDFQPRIRPGNHLIKVNNGLNTKEMLPIEFNAPGYEYYTSRRFGRNIFGEVADFFEAEIRTSQIPGYNKFYTEIPLYNQEFTSRRIANEIAYDKTKSLGLLLVELSSDCSYKKGAPLSGKGVLISWTKSPVRVFGGAILKKAPPFCRAVHY